MSKEMSSEELIEHINNSLEKVENMLHSLRMSPNPKDNQKSIKVAYWLNTYSDYIINENNFNPSSLPSYEYRSIINVDFGFRLGSEIGGWHYAVVLDKKNHRSSDTITVIPLTSLKKTYKENKYSVKLSEGIYGAFERKMRTQLEAANLLITQAQSILNELSKISEYEDRDVFIAEARIKSKAAKKTLEELDEIRKYTEKLKDGTVANISQITTISKRRIINPKSNKNLLYNIKISQEEMEQIQNSIKNLYIKG